jgi:hypothetical protein
MPEEPFDPAEFRRRMLEEQRRALEQMRREMRAAMDHARRETRGALDQAYRAMQQQARNALSEMERARASAEIARLAELRKRAETSFDEEAWSASAHRKLEAFARNFEAAVLRDQAMTPAQRAKRARDIQAEEEARFEALMGRPEAKRVGRPGKRPCRRPDEGGAPAMASPTPKPTPLAGGAEAPLD